jgi:hypothetical protein
MKHSKKLNNKKTSRNRTKYKLKHNQELRNNWQEITDKEWERIEIDEDFRDGFLLAMNNVLLKINTIAENWIWKRIMI